MLSQDTLVVHVTLVLDNQLKNSGRDPCDIFLQHSDEGAPLLHLFVFQCSELVSPTSAHNMLPKNIIILSEKPQYEQ